MAIHIVQVFNELKELVDQCEIEIPDKFTWLDYGKILDGIKIEGGDRVGAQISQKGYDGYYCVWIDCAPSAVIVAAYLINDLRLLESGEYRISWSSK